MHKDHRTNVAARKAEKSGVTDWEPYQWRVMSADAVAITGGKPRLLTRGPRKGRKTWDGKGHTEIVIESEVAAEFARYEVETGNCGDCFGEGKKEHGWNHLNGWDYKSCRRCGGSGTAPTDD